MASIQTHLLALISLFLSFSFPMIAEESPVLLIIGTRPEAIKMIPVYQALKAESIPTLICSTGQHAEIVKEIYALFGVSPDFELNIMKPGQDLSYITEILLNKTKVLFDEIKPAMVVVQGDTTSAMASALSAYYCKIPVAHVEAGLRTYNIYAPFPEEINRQIISRIAALHFTPTAFASQRLEGEGISTSAIYQTGNTVVDALYMMKEKIAQGEISPSTELKETIDRLKENKHHILLLTAHRRESFDGGLEEALGAIRDYLIDHPNLTVLYPIHLNPVIQEIIKKVDLENLPNLQLLAPLPYHDVVFLLTVVDGVLTDSGGLQEEAISLHQPTLVLRDENDRPEGLQTGFVSMVGTNPVLIKNGIEMMMGRSVHMEEKGGSSPFGDGKASQRISNIIKNYLKHSTQ